MLELGRFWEEVTGERMAQGKPAVPAVPRLKLEELRILYDGLEGGRGIAAWGDGMAGVLWKLRLTGELRLELG